MEMMCPYIRRETWGRTLSCILAKKRRFAGRRREPAPVRVGRGEQGKARRANRAKNGAPHLELLIARLRLKTWSKTDLSIAQTTGQHFRVCVYICVLTSIHWPTGFVGLDVIWIHWAGIMQKQQRQWFISRHANVHVVGQKTCRLAAEKIRIIPGNI